MQSSHSCLTTLCYMERDGKYLMLHRDLDRKKYDPNKGKWIGIGGHFEKDESPEECLIREVKEETGLTPNSWRYRAVITFVSEGNETEYMNLFTSDDFNGEMTDCDEGTLSWVKKEEITNLDLWEGDRIFLGLIVTDKPFFSLKLVYDADGRLARSILDGKELE